MQKKTLKKKQKKNKNKNKILTPRLTLKRLQQC